MLKILLVDDEILIRTNIKMMLNWEEHGFLICAEASNGNEALLMIEKHKPNMIIMDIRMPDMDGYQLSSIIYEKYKNLKMIILSNYDDFEYVKGTLKNGAIDYVLKHNLNQDILLDSLNRAKGSLIDTGKNYDSEFRTLNNIVTLREKFVLQLLEGFYRNNEDIKKQLSLLDINLGFYNILPVIMEIDNYKIIATSNSSTLKDKSLLEFSIINITDELLNEHRNGLVAHTSDKLFVILLSFPDVRSQAQIGALTDSLLNTISSCLSKFLEISVSFSIGNLCSSFYELPTSYEFAMVCLNNKFFIGNNCIVKNAMQKTEPDNLSGLSLEIEKQIFNYLRAGDSNNLETTVEELFSTIKDTAISINSARMVLYDLLNIVIKVCKENDIELNTIFSIGVTPQEFLSTLQTIDESKNWIMSLFNNILSVNSMHSIQYTSKYVKSAVSFIKKNYAKNISLSDAADEINIISTYLSKLFKDEVGIGFAEYLGNFRIEKAKLLLDDRNNDIKDVMEKCGFNNYDYFIKFFKKKVGLTPKEYSSKLSHR